MTDGDGREILQELFKHNLWATLQIVDACDGLPDDVLEFVTPGAYGTPRECLLHTLAAEERYCQVLGVDVPDPPLSEDDDFPGFPLLRERAARSGQALIDVAAELSAQDVWAGQRGDRSMEVRSLLLLVQAINHATEHREQIKSGLTQAGVEAPNIDGWTWGHEVGLFRDVTGQ
jgi:uncharacterized damage-inducible protein DinB